jgi:hypothetical protein
VIIDKTDTVAPLGSDRVRQIVADEMPRIANELGVGHWSIHFKIISSEVEEDQSRANCDAMPEYEFARIAIVAAGYGQGDEQDLVHDIRHELFHIVTSPIERLEDTIKAALGEESPLSPALLEVARQVAEEMVVNLERMYQAMLRAK